MKGLFKSRVIAKALSVVLVAGVIVTGVNLDAFAGTYWIQGAPYDIDDSYIYDYNGDGQIDEADYIIAYNNQEADRCAAEAARVAAEQEAARVAAEQEAQRKAEEAEAARIAAEQEAQRQAAEAEAARVAAEQPVKRDTPNAQKDLLANHRIVNIPENSAISGNSGVNWANCSGSFTFSDDQYKGIKNAVASQGGSFNILVKALGDGENTTDSDVQALTITTDDFPAEPKPRTDITQAEFDAATGVLSNLDYAKYSVDGGATWSTPVSGSVTIKGVHPDFEILVVLAARNESELDSETAQVIWIAKADTPTGVVANPATTIGGCGSLAHVAPGQEYCKSGTNEWKDINGTVVENVPVGSYDVRVKAKGTLLASDIFTVTVADYTHKKEDKPNAAFDGARLNLYNISCGCAYSVDDVNWTLITDASCTNVTLSRDVVEKAVHGNGIRIKRVGDGSKTIDSDWQTIAVAEAVKPTSVGTTPATSGNNGSLTGVAADMQYCKEGGNWVDIGSSTVTGLSAGKYFVRRRGSGTTIPSESVEVTIGNQQGPSAKQNTPNASFNAWNMTLSNVRGCAYSLDGGNGYSGKIDKDEVVLSEGDIKIDKGIKIIRCADGGARDSDVQTISLSKMNIPTGVAAISATSKTGGMINGVTSYMEYRAANSNSWIVPNGNTVANLPAGTYYVRNRGQHNAMPSDVLVVSIQMSSTATVVQPTASTIVVSPVSDTKKTDTKTEDKKTDTKTEDKKTETKTEETADTKTEESKSEETAAAEDVIDGGTTESATDSEKQPAAEKGVPTLITDAAVQGWGAIEGSMSKESTEPVAVDLTNSDTVIPATAIAAAATTETELILDVAPDMAWSIVPTEITSAGADIDLGVVENTNDIPRELVAKVETEDGKVAKEFTIKHEGDFGFKAHLTVALDKEDAGKTAKLYYYNKTTGLMEVVDTAVINEYGEATFALTHASSYAVTVSTKVASAGDKANVTEKTKEKKSSSKWWIWVIVIAVILTAAGCGTVVYLKKKEEEAKRRRHQAGRNGSNHNGTNHNGPTHRS